MFFFCVFNVRKRHHSRNHTIALLLSFFILRMEALVFAYFIFWIVFIVILLIPNSSTFQPRSTKISFRFFSLLNERISLDTKSLKSKFQIAFDMRFAFREQIIEPFKFKLDFLRYRLNQWTLSLVLISLKSIELIWTPFYLSLDRFRGKNRIESKNQVNSHNVIILWH